jgi:hypothetical protein
MTLLFFSCTPGGGVSLHPFLSFPFLFCTPVGGITQRVIPPTGVQEKKNPPSGGMGEDAGRSHCIKRKVTEPPFGKSWTRCIRIR